MNKKLLLSVMVLTLLLASCSQPAASPTPTEIVPEPAVTIEPTTEPTTTAEPTREPVATFEEAPCPFDVPEDLTVECGFVVVPEDHHDPGGPTIRLAVAILKDQSDEPQPDPVILLAGGPGEKTVQNAPGLAQLLAPVHPNRDLIIFDQRGVGLSEPALECPERVQAFFDLLDEPDPNVALQTVFDAMTACRDRLGSEGHDLSAFNTAQNASDVDAIRIALGYDQVNLWGGSYGSLLAQATMRDHPQGIRSAAIISVLPLEKSLFVEASTTTSNAVMRLLDACAADEACNSAYPNLQEVLFEVIDQLNEEPVPITVTSPLDGQSYDAILTGDAVLGNLVTFLYFTQIIPVLPQAIHDVHNEDYELMTQLSSTRLALLDVLSRGMMLSVMCTDDLIDRTPEDLLNIMATLPRQLVGSVDPEFQIEYGIFGICENWPVEEADPWVKEPLVSDIPTLALSGEFDPVTPPEYGRLVAGYLSDSYFFELPGIGHDILGASECARSIIGDFFADPTQAPDASCIAEMPGLVFDVPGEAAEVALEPFTDVERGFSGLVPAGWTELAPANLARGSSALDPTYFVLEATPGTSAELFGNLAGQLGLDPGLEPVATAEVGNFTWGFYTFELQGNPADLALAEDAEKAYFVLLISAPDEHDALYDQLFLPAVEALAPLVAETEAEAEDEVTGEVEITLVPYTSEAFGISGVVPEGWGEASPGIFARGSSASDVTVLLAQAAPVSAEDLLGTLTEQLGLDETPESVGEREANGLTWTFHIAEVQGVIRDIALAESEGLTLIVILRSSQDERDRLYEAVFLPVVDALVPIESVGEFSIYLTTQEAPAASLSQADLDPLELENQPILSSDDVLRYSRETHEIVLTSSAYERINQLSVPTGGRGFVVCVGNERIYSGAFWPLFSSQSSDGVVIEVPLVDQSMRIQLGYPESLDLFKGEDSRSNVRVLQSLERAGKLE